MSRVATFAEIQNDFIERAHAAVWCNVASIDSRGRPRSRVLHPIWQNEIGWIATTRTSPKAKHIANSPFLSLAYVADPFKPVYAECHAEWVDDPPLKQQTWELFKRTPEPLGYDPGVFWPSPDHEAFGLLRLKPWRVELYDLIEQGNIRLWEA